jgi:hypothetical protein
MNTGRPKFDKPFRGTCFVNRSAEWSVKGFVSLDALVADRVAKRVVDGGRRLSVFIGSNRIRFPVLIGSIVVRALLVKGYRRDDAGTSA